MRCLLQALLLLHLVYDSAHAPSGVCPSMRYCSPCDPGNVVCTLESLEKITDLLMFNDTSIPVDKLTVNSCNDQYENIEENLNVKSLTLNCPTKTINNYVILFDRWKPYLETIVNQDVVSTKSEITGNQTCPSICSPNNLAPIIKPSICICNTRTRYDGDNITNTTLSTMYPIGIYGDNSTNTSLTTISTIYLNQSTGDNSTNTSLSTFGNSTQNTTVETYNLYHLLVIGCPSVLTFLVNFVLLTTTCVVREATLIDVFGLSLMVFNILLSLYGVALTVYMWLNYTTWSQRFCQGFTSVKLFALGALVWTLIMLTFHRTIRGDIDDDGNEDEKKEKEEKEKEEKEKKKKETDAIFKGIVYILEGLMLSGVLAVMSWIKLDRWGHFCIIFEPITIVDWLLTGIELFYYFIVFCLVLRYPYSLFKKSRRKLPADHKKKDKDKDRSHTIFIMVFMCFVIWVSAYVITLPRYGMFTDKLRRAIRVGALIFPLFIQPIIYIIRNTCCCLCNNAPCRKKKEKGKQSADHCVLLVCECTGSQKCPACEPEYLEKFGNTQFYEKEANGGTQKKKKKAKQNKKEEKKKKKKKRKNEVAEPKSIERSPILKQRSFDDAVAETPLLGNEDDATVETENMSLVSKNMNFATDSTPLLDDVDGAKQPPKATPDGTPIKTLSNENNSSVTTDHPSFINMESAVDVDALPKEKTQKAKNKLIANNKLLLDEEGRKSRGPTFFPLAEKNNGGEEKAKKRTKKRSEGEHKNSKKTDTGSKKLKRSKSKENNKDGGKKINTNNDRNSTISLEWDHYSDSSSGSISRVSDCFPDELVVTPTDNGKRVDCNHQQNNGISAKIQDSNAGEDLNKNTNDVILMSKNKQKTDLINQNSNGKVTSAM